MRILFVDSNLLFHCRPLQDLPWGEVAGNQDVLLLLIPREVQKEIDRLKHDGNSRRAKRARAASSLIRAIIQTENEKQVVRETSPRVEVSFPPAPKNEISFEAYGLDPAEADDRVIGEALTFRTDNPESEVLLLTHDTNPILTAKRCDLATELIPDDWLLAPEPDAQDRKIAKLQEELRTFKSSSPDIDLYAHGQDGRHLESLEINVAEFRRLTSEEIDNLVTRVVQKYPMATEFNMMENTPPHLLGMSGVLRLKYKPAVQEAIEKYQQVDYPKWVEAVRQFFTSLAEKLEASQRRATLWFRICNMGHCPAQHVTVRFRALGGLLFALPDQADRPAINPALPECPTPPKGKWVGEAIDFSLRQAMAGFDHLTRPAWQDFIPSIASIAPPTPRDRNSFYWRSERPSSHATVWEFECEEFRHKSEPEDFEVSVYLPSGGKVEKCAVECVVSATNVPNPHKMTVPVSINVEKYDTMEKIAE